MATIGGRPFERTVVCVCQHPKIRRCLRMQGKQGTRVRCKAELVLRYDTFGARSCPSICKGLAHERSGCISLLELAGRGKRAAGKAGWVEVAADGVHTFRFSQDDLTAFIRNKRLHAMPPVDCEVLKASYAVMVSVKPVSGCADSARVCLPLVVTNAPAL